MYLIFDTETTGLPRNYNAPVSDSQNWPRAVQIAWQLHDDYGQLVEHQDFLITPDDYTIPYDAERIHGISTELAQKQGVPIAEVFEKFNQAIEKATYVVGQNIGFDINIMGAEFYRYGVESKLSKLPVLDTCTEITAELCKIPGGRGGKFKLPTLTELHEFLFGVAFEEAHNATADVEATARCFFELIRIGQGFTREILSAEYLAVFRQKNPDTIQLVGLKHINLKKASQKLRALRKKKQLSPEQIAQNLALLETVSFAHLHNHSKFSVLQSTSSILDLIKLAGEYQMPAVALTDTGNMMGTFHFVREVLNFNKKIKEKNLKNQQEGLPVQPLLKPIIGCEFFVCENRLDKSFKDNGYQMVMLAKNMEGYRNLAKMASIAYIEGFYYVPRIDKEVVKNHTEGVIALSGSLSGELYSKALNMGEKQTEEALIWWKEQFGEDFYVEIIRHNQEEEERANEILVELAQKHNVKLAATNNTYYSLEKDANAHDILLCVKDGEKLSTPKGIGRGKRYGLPNQEYYFKTQQQMKELFKDLPQAIVGVQEIIDKIEPYSLAREILLPKFEIPERFWEDDDPDGKKGENNYLRYLTYKGAEKRYKEITPEITERLDFELDTIRRTGYPGYFLIVQDFIAAARDMDIAVGPGRGSAAGSAVAYCLGITNVDPITYDLLFERFLNPERVSMPDIDIDFEDVERERVIDYVVNKYGANQVAQIITYGTMAAKSSIRDTARVMDLPLNEADRIAKLIPDNAKLSKIFAQNEEQLRQKNRSEEVQRMMELKKMAEETSLQADVIHQAIVLEGSMRNTGVHACGIIITPEDITNYVPVAISKSSNLWVTQFDNSVVESAGLLKMDFLGLKTLTLIKDAISLVRTRHGIEIDIEAIPIDDAKTYELFQQGRTVGIFQYESAGMQKYMKELVPTVFADLIAMNALYRPGPLEYIPQFIRRKNKLEPITYDLPEMQEFLEETYGITVYQEQVMLLSQKLAGFTKGQADMLRKAMGKKIAALLQELKPKFIEGGLERGHPKDVLEKIWKDWEAFASYAFNKSHSTCYAWVAYQTAYLKANYPPEYMAALLSNHMDDIKEVSFLLDECKAMGIRVLPPDVNESQLKFTVNEQGEIRFGLGAIKGVGRSAVESLIRERANGRYVSVFEMAKRMDLRSANRRVFENMVVAGAMDAFGLHRSQYFYQEPNSSTTHLDKLLRIGAQLQKEANSVQLNLFEEMQVSDIPEPAPPKIPEWGIMEKLRREKETIGTYISAHPLDDFKHEMAFCTASVSFLNDNKDNLTPYVGRRLRIGGMVTQVEHHLPSDRGGGWGAFTIEDESGSYTFRLYGEEYVQFHNFMMLNAFVYCRILVQEGYTNKKTKKEYPPRLKFEEIYLLQDVIPRQVRQLNLIVDLKKINPAFTERLKEVLDKHQGEASLSVVVFQHKKGAPKPSALQMHSRRRGVKPSHELLEALSSLSLDFNFKR